MVGWAKVFGREKLEIDCRRSNDEVGISCFAGGQRTCKGCSTLLGLGGFWASRGLSELRCRSCINVSLAICSSLMGSSKLGIGRPREDELPLKGFGNFTHSCNSASHHILVSMESVLMAQIPPGQPEIGSSRISCDVRLKGGG